MGRRRLAVALLLPEPVTTEIDGIRRALGVDTGYIPPHITIVPPVNVPAGEIAAALAVMRSAAAAVGAPLPLTIGPSRTFLPRQAVLFLDVDGSRDELLALKVDATTGPLDRTDGRRFIPHVTLTTRIDPARTAEAVALLAHYREPVSVESLHLLEQLADDEGRRRWIPVADVPLAPRRVVGRGGLELELTSSELADPEVSAHLAAAGLAAATTAARVVAARRGDDLVGVLLARRDGSRLVVEQVHVSPEHRRQGIAGHLLAAAEADAAESGLDELVAWPGDALAAALFASRGWLDLGTGGGEHRRRLGRGPGASRPHLRKG